MAPIPVAADARLADLPAWKRRLVHGLSSGASPGFDGYLDRLDEARAQNRDFFRLHEPLLEPEPIVCPQRLVLCQGVLKIRAEASIFPFAKAGLLGVLGMIEICHRIALRPEDE